MRFWNIWPIPPHNIIDGHRKFMATYFLLTNNINEYESNKKRRRNDAYN